MSTGQAMQAVMGGDRTVPLAVPYSEPKPKQKGLDWGKISPPADETTVLPKTTAEVRSEQLAKHAEAIERVERLEGRAKPSPAPTPVEKPEPEWTYDKATGWTEKSAEAPATAPPDETWFTTEVLAVAHTLRDTESSKDMVVSACRAAVIAAADALRGAALRSAEARRVRPDGRKQMGQPRIEEKHPEILEKIRGFYFDDGRGIEWIAAELGLSPNTVSRVMHRNGMRLRKIGESNENARTRVRARLEALGVTSLQVREWAAEHGIDVSERGFLSEDVLSRFEAAR